MRRTNKSKENEWALIHSNQVMENDQITNVCNDGEDNDPESLGKGHLFLTRKIHNEIDTRRWEPPKSSHTNSHKQLTKPRQLSMSNIYTQWRITLYTYINTCAYYFFFIFFSTHTLNINQMNSTKNTLWNGYTLKQWHIQTLIDKMTFLTKDLRTNVHEIGVEGDMTVLHALKCERSSLMA